MKSRTSYVIALSMIVAACSADSPAPTLLEETSTSLAAPTTTEPSTTTTTTQPSPPAEISELLGLGDSRYPSLGNTGYDVEHYNVDLTFDPDPKTLSARVEIEAVATQTLDAFSLDFIGFEITDLTVDDVTVEFERRGGELIVSLPSVVATGESFVTAVSYNGTPGPIQSEALPFELGWRTDISGTNYVVSEPDGGRSWLPLNDHPSDKAAYTFQLTVPDPVTAAANGTLVEQITDLGWTTWVWDSPEPMASYLATVVIGELEIIEDASSTALSGVPIRNVLPDGVSAASLAVLNRQGEMMEYFEEIFGPYPFETYGIAVVDDFEGALENQTLSIFGSFMVESPSLFEIVLVHELAHQWFGNSLTPADWGDIWLNEGFATYAEWLWIEHTAGRSAMTATIEGNRNSMAAITDLPPPGNPPADDLFNASVYIRGGLVLHALRVEVGDDAFFEIIRRYADDYHDGGVTTQAFIDLAEAVSQSDLTDLFDTWLYGEEVPPLPAWSQ